MLVVSLFFLLPPPLEFLSLINEFRAAILVSLCKIEISGPTRYVGDGQAFLTVQHVRELAEHTSYIDRIGILSKCRLDQPLAGERVRGTSDGAVAVCVVDSSRKP